MHLDGGIVDGLGAGVAGEIESRRIADAHQKQITAEPLLHGLGLAVTTDGRDGHALEFM